MGATVSDQSTNALKDATKSAKKDFGTKPAGSPTHSCPASNPCRGIGLHAPSAVKEYVEDFKKLQKDWPRLTPAQRRQRLEQVAGKQLAKSGAPPVKVVGADKGGPANASFGGASWSMDVDKKTLNSNKLSDDDAKKMADSVYHESRHAEQYYMESRMLALEGKSESEIRDYVVIPGNVAKAAKKQPAVQNSLVACCGDVMRNAYDTPDARKKRKRVIENRKQRSKELEDAKAEYEKTKNDPKSSPTMIEWADRKVRLADARDDMAYDAYRNLPEEADAWHAGDLVSNAW